MAILHSDSDLPEALNTPRKQLEKAKQLASSMFPATPAKEASMVELQGCFSRTAVVILADDRKIVLQYRREPLSITPFDFARARLGQVVPLINEVVDVDLKQQNIWTYCMSYISGSTWLEARQLTLSQGRVAVARSLGQILSKGYVAPSSQPAIKQIRQHLKLIIASEDTRIMQFRSVAMEFLNKLDDLATLPLFVAHFDLNNVNIMVNDDFEVSGLIDWEFSTPLPLGTCFSRIHTLFGQYTDGKFCIPEEFYEAEKHFWQEIWQGIPTEVSQELDSKLETIQLALCIGALLDTFELDHPQVDSLGSYNLVAVNALEKKLTYHLPMLRAKGEPAYRETL